MGSMTFLWSFKRASTDSGDSMTFFLKSDSQTKNEFILFENGRSKKPLWQE